MRLFDTHSIVHGTDPVSDDFSGRAFDVPDGRFPCSGGESMPPHSLYTGHSLYWDNERLNSLARIVTRGQP
ncbi:hypothetical protein [Streptomyces sp. NPDC052042]|uniref:hypothetical protein n=1 Tax=Streptomyces sp. NPDC052042 TaxID=3365683 RepID=UPI0037D2DD89